MVSIRIHTPCPTHSCIDYYHWAGTLLLDGPPTWQVAVDGRLYLFKNTAEWRPIEDVGAGRISLGKLEREHHPDGYFSLPGRKSGAHPELGDVPALAGLFPRPDLRGVSSCPMNGRAVARFSSSMGHFTRVDTGLI
jgi:hypothetical protein